MEENATTIHTLQYLYSIDACLTGISGVDNILRQNYLQKAKRLEQRDGITLPSKTIKPRVKCPKCSMPRSNCLAEFRLRRNARQNRFLARLKRKVEDGKLTKYQRRFLKMKNGMLDQVQSIRCNVCKYVVTEPVTKPDFLKTKYEIVGKNKVTEKTFVNNENKQAGNKQMNNKHGTANHNNQQNKRNDNKNKGKGNVAKLQSNKNNKRQQNKMQTMLASACKLKSTNLKDFIKSVT